MEDNIYNTIQVNSNRSIKKIVVYIIVILLFVVFAVICIFMLIKKNNIKLINIDESGDINYKVYLKDNKYFEEEYREANKQYVPKLISNVNANIKYKINISGKDSYECTYRVTTKLNVKDTKTNNSIYEDEKVVVEEKKINNDGKQKVYINEDVELDYSKYNEIVSSFIEDYRFSSRNIRRNDFNIIC